MVLYLVDQRLRMLYADSEGEALCLKLPTLSVEHFIYVAGRVAGSEDNLA